MWMTSRWLGLQTWPEPEEGSQIQASSSMDLYRSVTTWAFGRFQMHVPEDVNKRLKGLIPFAFSRAAAQINVDAQRAASQRVRRVLSGSLRSRPRPSNQTPDPEA